MIGTTITSLRCKKLPRSLEIVFKVIQFIDIKNIWAIWHMECTHARVCIYEIQGPFRATINVVISWELKDSGHYSKTGLLT